MGEKSGDVTHAQNDYPLLHILYLPCLIKTDIVDNAEPSISVTLGEGKNFVFKTSNLNSLEVLQEFNKIVLPLVPKEEEVSGKIAGKLAGKSKAVSSAGKQKQKKK